MVFNGDGSQSPAFPLPFAARGPVVAATGIVNAASGLPGAFAPGEIISVTGTGFGTPQMVSRRIHRSDCFRRSSLKRGCSSTALQLHCFMSPRTNLARSFRIRFERPSFGHFRARISADNVRLRLPRFLLSAASPALFTQNSTGLGAASASEPGRLANSVGNPATAGSVIVLFGTGEGLLVPGWSRWPADR